MLTIKNLGGVEISNVVGGSVAENIDSYNSDAVGHEVFTYMDNEVGVKKVNSSLVVEKIVHNN
jgi:hypothetical protein